MSTPPMEPAAFAALVRGASDEDLAAGLRANREVILAGIFEAMPATFLAEHAAGLEAVAEWRVRIEGEDAPERWQVRMASGTCSVQRGGEAAPDVIYELGGVDFLRLVSGQVDGPQLFVTGRIRVEGDLMLAARMPALFKPPSLAGGPPGGTARRPGAAAAASRCAPPRGP